MSGQIWKNENGVWAAKGQQWHWFEDVNGKPILRSRCGTLLFSDDADRDACTNRDPRGPVIGWPCRLCLRYMDLDHTAPKDEQIAILSLLLNILKWPGYDGHATLAAKAAYQRFREGDQRIRFVVELEPGVWLSEAPGDPGRALKEYNATYYSARGAIAALSDARRYRSFEHAKIIPAGRPGCAS